MLCSPAPYLSQDTPAEIFVHFSRNLFSFGKNWCFLISSLYFLMNSLFGISPRHPLHLVFIIALLALLAGCSASGKFFEDTAPKDMDLSMAPQILAQKGMEEYNRGKYFVALEYFNTILDNHRFTPEALLAELKVADCHYYMEKYTEAYVYYEKFEEMHPTNEAIPYVMYQKAMCYYKRIDTIDRDISNAKKAIERFQLLVKAYPESPYITDAEAKLKASREFLANHEFSVAKFYIRTKEPDQAVVRLNYLLAMYPQTEIVSQARDLLSEVEAKR